MNTERCGAEQRCVQLYRALRHCYLHYRTSDTASVPELPAPRGRRRGSVLTAKGTAYLPSAGEVSVVQERPQGRPAWPHYIPFTKQGYFVSAPGGVQTLS